jgi:hypothetical protein
MRAVVSLAKLVHMKRAIQSMILVSLAGLLMTGPASAAPRQSFQCENSPLDIFPDQYYSCEAMQSFKKGFDSHALSLFKRAARWGSKTSQYRVGLMYLGGYGTAVNPIEGTAWLLLANERNSTQGTQQLNEALKSLSDYERKLARERAQELSDDYGDLKALERRSRWVRRMKGRTTGSRLGRPTATVRIEGANGITGDQAISRLDLYETVLRNAIGTIEYRDFEVIEPASEDARPED